MCLITESFCIVIVEGGVKSVRRYEKLMMRRIDWNAQVDGENGAELEYDDDTPATGTQMAKDVTTFLAWAAEPEADDRKLMGAKFMFALSLVAVQAVYYKRWMWSPIKARRLVVNAVH